jgi:hypothetical protein
MAASSGTQALGAGELVLNPASHRRVGLVQFVLAASFVVLLLRPGGGEDFAWPVSPRSSAIFIGVSFMLRALAGVLLWRVEEWYRLRWFVPGNYAFLTIVFLATMWHVHEMNWQRSLVLAHVWIVAYVVEPLILPYLQPRNDRLGGPLPAGRSEGPILPGLRNTLIATLVVSAAIAALLFINPEFTNTRWPWPITAFDARIMAAWAAGWAAWAAGMAFATDWAEIRLGIAALMFHAGALAVAWAVFWINGWWDFGRHNVHTSGLVVAVAAGVLAYYYRRQMLQSGSHIRS